MVYRLIIFLLLNFAALAIGILLSGSGSQSEWYADLAKAPWNPAFFYYNKVLAGLLIISGLTVLIAFCLIYYWPELKVKSLLILPYLIWLLIATSLNAYVLVKN